MNLWLFATPQTHLAILQECARKRDLHLVLQRHERDPGSLSTNVHVVRADEDAAELFIAGSYRQAFLSTVIPTDEQDTGFFERAALPDDFIIEMSGGRALNNTLEQAHLRIFFNPSKAKSTFSSIRRAVKKVCNQGVIVDDKWPYPKVYWERNLANDPREWISSLKSGSINKSVPMP